MRYFSIVFLLIIPILSFTQKINPQQILIKKADDLLKKEEAKAANKIYKNLLQDFSKNSFPDTTKAYILSQYAMSFGYQSDWENALKYSHQAAAIYEQSLGESNKKTIEAYYNLGDAHSALEDFDSLSFYWLKCIDLYELKKENYHDIALTYNNLGSNFSSQTYYYKAYKYFKKAVEYWEKVADEKPNYLAIGYDNLGATLETQEGIYYLQKALNIKLKNGKNPFRSYIEIGSKYQDLEQFSQALFYYEKGLIFLNEAIKNPPKKDFAYKYDLAVTYSLISSIYESQTDFEQAIIYLEQAIEITIAENYSIKKTQFLIRKANILSKQGKNKIALKILENIFSNIDKSPLFGYVTNILAGVYAEEKDFENALIINQLSIDFNQNRNTNKTTRNFLQRFKVQGFPLTSNAAISVSNHANFLNQYATLFSSNATKQVEILETALHNIEVAIALFKQIQNRTNYHLYTKRKFNQATNRQQEILFALAKLTNENRFLEQAFAASEVGKFNSTLVNFNRSNLQKIGNVPPTLLKKEQDLKIQISQLKDEIYYAEKASKNTDNSSIRKQYDELFELNKTYKKLLTTYENDYPNYYKVRHQLKPVSIQQLQKQLDNSTVLISYFVGESQVFIYEITKENFTARQIEKSVNFEKDIQYYRKNLQDFTADISDIQQKGKDFYNFLLKSTLKKYPNERQILLIPDKELSTIPFETFVKNEKYLIENYTIHYAYSATLWQQQKTLNRQKAKQFWAGFAPTYNDFTIAKNDTLTDNLLANFVRNKELELQGTKVEVEQISQLLKGKTYLNEAASKANFKMIADDFQILHLAMHALLEDENPMYSKLLFTQKGEKENGFLTISELYNLQLHADLAVLSACNTGFGKLQPGEGVLSLSQAFMSAGCPSTLTTLWQIPDTESADLMVDFYKNLKSGQSKSEALQNAKINYLQTTSNPRAKHPYFWAGFLLSGDEKAIAFKTNFGIFWWLFSGLILVGLLFFVYKKRFQN